MLVTLNEYTLALLCGGVSCLTYVLIHLNDINENQLSSTKKQNKKNNKHSENTYENAGGDSSPANSEISSRRQSQLAARFRSKRAESVKNDHVFFADEFQDQDLKFTPHLDDPETESQPEVEGILQNTAGGIDVETIEDFEAPSLNTFEKSQPLDDLLIRRRSLHSSPANSRSGSRSGSVRISAPGDGDSDEENAFDAQDLQVKSLKGEIASLRADLANYKENESKLEKDKEHLEKVLEAALAKLFPEKYGEKISDSVNMDFLTSYVQENCTM